MLRIKKQQPVKQQSRKGAAIVEFAMFAPLFVVLTLGAIQANSAISTTMLLNSSIREGGRLATMDWGETVPDGTTPQAKVLEDIQNFLEAGGIPADELELSIVSAEGADAGQAFDLTDPDNEYRLFRISATIPYSETSPFHSAFTNGNDLTASLVFRKGRSSLSN